MATTMNPADVHHNVTLDEPVSLNANTRRVGDANSRNADQTRNISSDAYDADDMEIPLQEANTSVGPPITYRSSGSRTDPKVHRSFSQRAKGRPFAEEAFANDNTEEPTPTKRSRDNVQSASSNNHIQDVVKSESFGSNGQHAKRSEQRRQQPPNTTVPVSQNVGNSHVNNGMQGEINDPTLPRSATLKDAANQTEDQSNTWASDRSPLQKLEVKLTDISKEEKRARVQEAEMRLRDSQASQGSRRTQRQVEQPARSGSNSIRINSQQTPRGLHAEERQAPQESIQQRSSRRAAADQGREKRTSRQGPMIDIPIRQHGSAHQTTTMQPSSHPRSMPPQETSQRGSRNLPGNAIAASNGHEQVARSVSLNQKYPQGSSRPNERPITDREKNASYQAALEQLTGQAPNSNNLQNSVQFTRRSHSMNQRPVVTGGLSTAQQPTSDLEIGARDTRQPDFNTPRSSQQSRVQAVPSARSSQRSQPVVGLGVQAPPPPTSINSRSLDQVDQSQSRQRKSSVSFKEPFDRRRPIDEWKKAETAKLTAEDFLTEPAKTPDAYKAWWEQDQSKRASKSRTSSSRGPPPAPIDDRTASFRPSLYLKCGPLLRYAGMKRTSTETSSGMSAREYWRGTVMIVTQDSQCSYEGVPILRLFSQPKRLLPPPPAIVTSDQLAPEYVDPIAGLTKLSRTGRALYVRPVDHLEEAKDLSRFEDDNGMYEASPSPLDGNVNKDATTAITNKRTLDTDGERIGRYKEVKGVRIYADPDRDVTFWRFNIEIELGPEQQHVAYRINKGASVGFWVPARGRTMNIMFHSCNGFSMSVDPNEFSGPDPLWRDVLNNHQTRPFHVMIGGGDQVYNDRVMVDTKHFAEWTKIRNPHHKHQAPFTPEMKEELETFYLERYSMWFSQGLFGMANASIPMVNVWDDHDIIDGFGSYPDDFMKSPVFSGLGDIAHKYYLLFQHQTIDAMTEKDEPSWVLGKTPGPYIQHLSRSVYLELGQHVAFLGLDARTERTRHDVMSIDTLEYVLDRCRRGMIEGQTKHLIVLLGVPIAYPRLVWLENILTSKALDPIKALHRAGIVKTKLLNKFDGGVEILDDLDDHWTASHHKDERNILIEELQDLAAEKSARVTILSGDVHLAAVGQFYSNPKLKVPKDKDHRYMPNIISSAIVNTPPPDMLADVLNKRNKVHHLNKYTDEDMIPMFTHDVDDKKRNNTRLLPRRNWCSIREYIPGDTPPPSPSLSASDQDDESFGSEVDGPYEQEPIQEPVQQPKRRLSLTKNDFNPRNLMRRISSRGAPPNSYKASDSGQFQNRAASMNDVDQSQASHGSYGQLPQRQSSSVDYVPDVPALRPTFQRRPTNLSEKAAKKGSKPAFDADGNEVHFNDHVNLEGGLDVVINCEVNQKDPAGITTQYRLLVPALSYDGSSDREKLNAAPPLNRRGTLLQKFGLNPQRGNRPADNQGAGNWGQEMSDSGSYTETEEETDEQPKKRFSLFGSLRKKQPQQIDTSNIQHPHLTEEQIQRNDQEIPVQRASKASDLPESMVQPQPVAANSGRSSDREVAPQPRISQQSHSFTQQPVQRSAPSFSTQRDSQRSSRPLSYVIGGPGGPPPLQSEYSSTRIEGRPPYDPDAAYISNQRSGFNQGVQRSSTDSSLPTRNNTIGSINMDHAQPQQRQLRGNGIIGKNIPPSSYRNSSDMQSEDPENTSRGYSGIEAYKDPKPKRRWSLKDKARNILDRVDSRRRKDDDEWYSDEDEEAYWEGNAPPQRYS